MTFIRKIATVGSAAVAALVLMSVVGADTVHAQAALPYQAYGSGLTAGATVEAMVGDEVVGTSTVDADGNWIIQIAGDAAEPGDTVNFSVDGVAQEQTVTFQSGGFVAPPGLTLTDGEAAPEAPAPAPTGNAGLVGSTSNSMALVLMLGVFAAALAAGARVATSKR